MGAAERLAVADGTYLAVASVRGKSVLLIDDVVTTGAQASDGTRALLAAEPPTCGSPAWHARPTHTSTPA